LPASPSPFCHRRLKGAVIIFTVNPHSPQKVGDQEGKRVTSSTEKNATKTVRGADAVGVKSGLEWSQSTTTIITQHYANDTRVERNQLLIKTLWC